MHDPNPLQPPPKRPIAPQGTAHGPGHDTRTGHLRPVIEFLLAQGNCPAQWWHTDGWRSDPGGELHYAFTGPIDAAQLREHFAFPESIVLDDAGTIRDGVNRVDIYHQQPPTPFSFEQP
ncbi:hypothetical protein [Hymenobacter sp. APR13]|uniref:hypothetical protein n=1 Tax=Hymenobacter sp. APR13 TaxID=1356852 RepID=UPI0018CD04E4|nr:hypothetical protein [Hymenobacter sp. APR13]